MHKIWRDPIDGPPALNRVRLRSGSLARQSSNIVRFAYKITATTAVSSSRGVQANMIRQERFVGGSRALFLVKRSFLAAII